MDDNESILTAISNLKARLQGIDRERDSLLKQIDDLQIQISNQEVQNIIQTASVTTKSTPQDKISLFRSLFRGREDAFPKLWISAKKGSKGYSPVCENEWKTGLCKKPQTRCGECDNREFAPVTDEVIRQHLEGSNTIGVYPLLEKETCYFLAIDFDKKSWQDDVTAFMAVCKAKNIPAGLERSRSGNGGHVWMFFSEAVPAALARHLGTYLLTETMEQHHQLDMKSYDRLFPSQDTMPKGGFGNLIVLPLQKVPREQGNSVFVDDRLIPYPDQWAYLSTVKRMSLNEVQTFVDEALRTKDLLRIRTAQTDDEAPPWEKKDTSKTNSRKLSCKLPSKVNVILANRIYIIKEGLPSQLLTQFKRLAAFQNPEFYKKQAMRFSTALTPRIICCVEDMEKHLAIPRGCLEEFKEMLAENNISLEIQDKRFSGEKCKFVFKGDLNKEQKKAYKELIKYETGIFVAPPGIGKTVIGIRLIAEKKTNTLVLVHRKPLLDQWRNQISLFLGIPIKEIGQIGGGKDKATNVIDVAMIQSFHKQHEADSRIKNYGHIIVDECHHISAVSFERVLMEANARYITGLTATPYRSDGHQPIITMQCGPVRHKIKAHSDSEMPFNLRLVTRATNFQYPWNEGRKITDVWPLLVKDEERNKIICDDILENLKGRRSIIALTERREHLELLKEKLQNHTNHIIVLHGGIKSKERKKLLAKTGEIADNEGQLILATGPYIGEGFDAPRLDTLFLTMPFSFKGKMVQYAGRLLRSHKGKTEVRIYDYIDGNVSVLQRMYRRRLKAYRSLGFTESKL